MYTSKFMQMKRRNDIWNENSRLFTKLNITLELQVGMEQVSGHIRDFCLWLLGWSILRKIMFQDFLRKEKYEGHLKST